MARVDAAKGGSPSKIRWVYSVFPVSFATGPIGTLVLLYLIQLDGVRLGTIYGSLANALFNGVGIPAAIFWGAATDRIHSRRLLISASFAMMALVLVAFYFDQTAAGTIFTYSVFAFVSAASATPLNLLIMETEEKSRWAIAFARLSMVSSVGQVGGLVLSTVWTQVFPKDLILLSLPLGALSLASAGLSLAMISEHGILFEQETVAMRKSSFLSRLLSFPVFFTSLPRLSDFRRIFRGLRFTLTSYLPLFYVSLVCFYMSAGLFNTSFVPAMSSFSLSVGETFLVILAGMVVQTLAFRWAERLVKDRALVAASIQGLLLRGWAYVLVGVAAFFLAGPLFFVPAIVLYPLASGVAFALYYTSSNTMMFNSVQRRNPGAALGVYSAVVGIAAMAGSFASGFISVSLGFGTTFILAGILLFAAVGIVARLPRSRHPESGLH